MKRLLVSLVVVIGTLGMCVSDACGRQLLMKVPERTKNEGQPDELPDCGPEAPGGSQGALMLNRMTTPAQIGPRIGESQALLVLVLEDRAWSCERGWRSI